MIGGSEGAKVWVAMGKVTWWVAGLPPAFPPHPRPDPSALLPVHRRRPLLCLSLLIWGKPERAGGPRHKQHHSQSAKHRTARSKDSPWGLLASRRDVAATGERSPCGHAPPTPRAMHPAHRTQTRAQRPAPWAGGEGGTEGSIGREWGSMPSASASAWAGEKHREGGRSAGAPAWPAPPAPAKALNSGTHWVLTRGLPPPGLTPAPPGTQAPLVCALCSQPSKRACHPLSSLRRQLQGGQGPPPRTWVSPLRELASLEAGVAVAGHPPPRGLLTLWALPQLADVAQEGGGIECSLQEESDVRPRRWSQDLEVSTDHSP